MSPADGAFVAENGAIGYLVTSKSLVVSEGNKVIREESMVDFHGAEAPAAPASRADADRSAAATVARRGGWRRVSRRSSAHQR